MVELRPRHPTIIEYIVWVWAATMWLEELRQVTFLVSTFELFLMVVRLIAVRCSILCSMSPPANPGASLQFNKFIPVCSSGPIQLGV